MQRSTKAYILPYEDNDVYPCKHNAIQNDYVSRRTWSANT